MFVESKWSCKNVMQWRVKKIKWNYNLYLSRFPFTTISLQIYIQTLFLGLENNKSRLWYNYCNKDLYIFGTREACRAYNSGWTCHRYCNTRKENKWNKMIKTIKRHLHSAKSKGTWYWFLLYHYIFHNVQT